MICALCLEEKELANSHVIPEFLYSALYDEMHRFKVLSIDENSPNKLEQKGLREKLLCSGCENRIGVYERYVSLLIHGGIELDFETAGDLDIITNVNYKLIRLFQLSILWRAGASSLPFFSTVSLGPHQERLRKLIFAADVGLPWQYGCLMCSILHSNELQKHVIVQPTWTKVGGVFGYRFVCGGFAWIFCVASHQTYTKLETASLDPKGELHIFKTQLSDAKFIMDTMGKLRLQGKLR